MSCFRNLSSEYEMGSGCSSWTKFSGQQNRSRKKSSQHSAQVFKGKEKSNEVASQSTARVIKAMEKSNEVEILFRIQCENTSRKVENATRSSSLVLTEEEEKRQEIVKNQDKLSLEGSSVLKGREAVKNQDKLSLERPSVLKEEMKKKRHEAVENQDELSLERSSLRKERQKAEKDAPKPGPEHHSYQHTRRKTPTQIYHIIWDDFEEFGEQLGQKCCLCDIDLADEPYGKEKYDAEAYMEYYEDFSSFPEVAVLQCGHAFHQHCLQFITTEEKPRDPPCCICAK